MNSLENTKASPKENFKLEQDTSLAIKEIDISTLAQDIFSKYPSNAIVTKLNTPFEIKQIWLFNEWAEECQFSQYVRNFFPQRIDLDPANTNPNVSRIESAFETVRGKFILWQNPKEKGHWKKIVTEALDLQWIKENVEILYPSTDRFSLSELKGIVLWKDKSNKGKRYKLLEGNHRISTWLATQEPKTLPAVLFIGKPQKIYW